MHFKDFQILAYSLLVIILLSCNSSTGSGSSDSCRLLSNNIIHMNVKKNYYVDKFSNIFNDVCYIPLEATRNSIIGEVTSLEITNDGDYIIFDSQSKSVLRFAPDGRFLNNIGFCGPGEKEYVLPLDVKYDTFSNQVLVWDNGSKRILTYTMDGKISSKIHLPWYIATFGILDKDHIICYMNNKDGEDGTNYKIVRHDGTVVGEYGKYGTEMTGFNPPADNVFSFQMGRCLCRPRYSSTLFQAGQDSLKALVSFDLKENAIPHEWLSGSFWDLDEKLKKRPDLVEIFNVYEIEKYYILNLIKDRCLNLCLIQKDRKKISSISTNLINDMYGMVGITKFIYAFNDKILFSLDPAQFESKNSFIKSVPKGGTVKDAILRCKDDIYSNTASRFGPEAAVEHVDSLKSSMFKLVPGESEFIEEMSHKNNPIIQICTLK